ncbi:uncharacterized protein LOC131609900 [Vicia villosa]|uniref:uncharacterized protein LOC131609900 n=1 Tax=Vicia villosa TaxID=3911 RepID=UPI00273C0296|nr:uncharacterized protein LOC131609900 [Vicia villosa]XP_058737701.1 uncharacterized protein LOC131609900 [Vicia villosa]XP_058737702.1 uncharacterized protein LOC131609900 [Vicia villosa]
MQISPWEGSLVPPQLQLDEEFNEIISTGIHRRAMFDENGRLIRHQLNLSSKQYGFLLMLFTGILSYLIKSCTARFESFQPETATESQSLLSFERAFYAFFPEVIHITGFIICWIITFILTLPLQLVLQIFFGLLWLYSAIIYFVQLVEKTSASRIHVTSGDSLKLPLFWFAIIQAVGFSLIAGLLLFIIVYLSWKLVHKGNPRAVEVNVQQNDSTWWFFISFAAGSLHNLSRTQHGFLLMLFGGILSGLTKTCATRFESFNVGKTTNTPEEAFYAFFPEVAHITGFIICWIITFILILPLQLVFQIIFGLLWLCSSIIYFVHLVQKTSASGVHVASEESFKLPVYWFAIIQAVGFSLIIGLLLFIIVYLSWKYIHKGNCEIFDRTLV